MFPEECPSCEDLLMTCDWLKLYDAMHVLEGRYGYCEDFMRPRIKRSQKMMQALRRERMKFVDSDTRIGYSLDTVNFLIQEPRSDPSAKWYDPKSKSAGLVSSCVFCIIVKCSTIFIVLKSYHFQLCNPTEI